MQMVENSSNLNSVCEQHRWRSSWPQQKLRTEALLKPPESGHIRYLYLP